MEDDKDYQPTEHPDIFRVEEDLLVEGERLQATLGELVRLSSEGDVQALVGLISERVPGSMIRQTPPPDLTSVL